MSVRVIAKKAYEFGAMESNSKIVVKVDPLIVTTVPDWVLKHDLFQLAQKGGNIEVMGDTSSDMSLAQIEELQELAKEYNIKNYKNMKPATLKEKIAEAQTSAQKEKEAEEADWKAKEAAAANGAGQEQDNQN